MSFSKRAVLGLSLVVMAGCGGGGGGGGDACSAYCGTGCTSALDCGFFPTAGLSNCIDGCISATVSNGATDAQCRAGQTQIASLTCAQLADLLNLRSSLPRSASGDAAVDVGVGLGAQCATAQAE